MVAGWTRAEHRPIPSAAKHGSQLADYLGLAGAAGAVGRRPEPAFDAGI